MKTGDVINYKHLNGSEYQGKITYQNSEYITTKVLKGNNVGSLHFIMKGNEKIKIEVM